MKIEALVNINNLSIGAMEEISAKAPDAQLIFSNNVLLKIEEVNTKGEGNDVLTLLNKMPILEAKIKNE